LYFYTAKAEFFLRRLLMKIFNATSDVILLRPFVDGVSVPKLMSTLIKVGEEAVVNGPLLPKCGLRHPYQLLGNFLIRDWDRPTVSWLEFDITEEVAIRRGAASIYKRPFALSRDSVEGFYVAFCDDCKLILY
jgi:hypothetical protein